MKTFQMVRQGFARREETKVYASFTRTLQGEDYLLVIHRGTDGLLTISEPNSGKKVAPMPIDSVYQRASSPRAKLIEGANLSLDTVIKVHGVARVRSVLAAAVAS